jgi:hypothetical protein
VNGSPLPAVPVHLQHRPTSGGLVVPAITPRTTRGRYLFGTFTDLAQYRLLSQYRCQICARPLPRTAVLFARPCDLLLRCTPEPATCPPCAAYSSRACPMISGQLRQYRASRHPALAGVPVPDDELARRGAPAERWYAVWVRHYDVINHPVKAGTWAASWRTGPPPRVRPVPTLAG